MTTTTADRAELVAGFRAPDQRAREGKGVATTAHIALILWSLLVILPLVWTVLSSFKSTEEVLGNPLPLPGKRRLSNYAPAWTTAGIGRYFANTVIVVASALVLVMI